MSPTEEDTNAPVATELVPDDAPVATTLVPDEQVATTLVPDEPVSPYGDDNSAEGTVKMGNRIREIDETLDAGPNLAQRALGIPMATKDNLDPKVVSGLEKERTTLQEQTKKRLAGMSPDDQTYVEEQIGDNGIWQTMKGAGKAVPMGLDIGLGKTVQGMAVAGHDLYQPEFDEFGNRVPMAKEYNAAMAKMSAGDKYKLLTAKGTPYDAGKEISAAAKLVFQQTPKEDRTTIFGEKVNAIVEGAAEMGSFVAAGHAAPAVIGLQTLGGIDLIYDEEIKKGKTPDEAAEIATKRAEADGAVQALIWKFIPPQLKKAFDKVLVDKVAEMTIKSALGKKAAQIATNRAAQIGEGSLMGGGTVAASNVVNERPLMEGVPEGARSMGMIYGITPRGRSETVAKPKSRPMEVRNVGEPTGPMEGPKMPEPMQGPPEMKFERENIVTKMDSAIGNANGDPKVANAEINKAVVPTEAPAGAAAIPAVEETPAVRPREAKLRPKPVEAPVKPITGERVTVKDVAEMNPGEFKAYGDRVNSTGSTITTEAHAIGIDAYHAAQDGDKAPINRIQRALKATTRELLKIQEETKNPPEPGTPERAELEQRFADQGMKAQFFGEAYKAALGKAELPKEVYESTKPKIEKAAPAATTRAARRPAPARIPDAGLAAPAGNEQVALPSPAPVQPAAAKVPKYKRSIVKSNEQVKVPATEAPSVGQAPVKDNQAKKLGPAAGGEGAKVAKPAGAKRAVATRLVPDAQPEPKVGAKLPAVPAVGQAGEPPAKAPVDAKKAERITKIKVAAEKAKSASKRLAEADKQPGVHIEDAAKENPEAQAALDHINEVLENYIYGNKKKPLKDVSGGTDITGETGRLSPAQERERVRLKAEFDSIREDARRMLLADGDIPSEEKINETLRHIALQNLMRGKEGMRDLFDAYPGLEELTDRITSHLDKERNHYLDVKEGLDKQLVGLYADHDIVGSGTKGVVIPEGTELTTQNLREARNAGATNIRTRPDAERTTVALEAQDTKPAAKSFMSVGHPLSAVGKWFRKAKREFSSIDINEMRDGGLISPEHAEIMQQLQGITKKLGIKVPMVTAVLEHGTAAHLDRATGWMRISENSSQRDFGKHVIHEAVHALVWKGLDYAKGELAGFGKIIEALPREGVSVYEVKQAAAKLEALFEKAKEHAKKTGAVDSLTGEAHYGLSSVHEFVAEAISNPRFQKFLSSIKGEGVKARGLFSGVSDAIHKMLTAMGLRMPSSALEDVLAHADTLVGTEGRERTMTPSEVRQHANDRIKESGMEPLNDRDTPEQKDIKLGKWADRVLRSGLVDERDFKAALTIKGMPIFDKLMEKAMGEEPVDAFGNTPSGKSTAFGDFPDSPIDRANKAKDTWVQLMRSRYGEQAEDYLPQVFENIKDHSLGIPGTTEVGHGGGHDFGDDPQFRDDMLGKGQGHASFGSGHYSGQASGVYMTYKEEALAREQARARSNGGTAFSSKDIIGIPASRLQATNLAQYEYMFNTHPELGPDGKSYIRKIDDAVWKDRYENAKDDRVRVLNELEKVLKNTAEEKKHLSALIDAGNHESSIAVMDSKGALYDYAGKKDELERDLEISNQELSDMNDLKGTYAIHRGDIPIKIQSDSPDFSPDSIERGHEEYKKLYDTTPSQHPTTGRPIRKILEHERQREEEDVLANIGSVGERVEELENNLEKGKELLDDIKNRRGDYNNWDDARIRGEAQLMERSIVNQKRELKHEMDAEHGLHLRLSDLAKLEGTYVDDNPVEKKAEPKAYHYKAVLKYGPDSTMDWDKLFDNQHPEVQRKLRALEKKFPLWKVFQESTRKDYPSMTLVEYLNAQRTNSNLHEGTDRTFYTKEGAEKFMEEHKIPDSALSETTISLARDPEGVSMSGDDLYQHITSYFQRRDVERGFKEALGGDHPWRHWMAMTSDALDSVGIKGHQFKDQGSRQLRDASDFEVLHGAELLKKYPGHWTSDTELSDVANHAGNRYYITMEGGYKPKIGDFTGDDLDNFSSRSKSIQMGIDLREGFSSKKEAEKFLKDNLPPVTRNHVTYKGENLEVLAKNDTPLARVEKWADRVLEQFLRDSSPLNKQSGAVVNPEVIAAMAVKGAIKVARGFTTFGKWSAEMLKEHGEFMKDWTVAQMKDTWRKAKAIAANPEKAERDYSDEGYVSAEPTTKPNAVQVKAPANKVGLPQGSGVQPSVKDRALPSVAPSQPVAGSGPGKQSVARDQLGRPIPFATPELQKAFNLVHEHQRWEGPEKMFSEEHNLNVDKGNGAWRDALEHVGDIVHRLSYSGYNDFGGGGPGWGMEAGLNKAERFARKFFDRPGNVPIAQDIQNEIGANYEWQKKQGKYNGTEAEFRQLVKEAGERYSQEYEKIQPVTEVQKLGRDAAIAVGRFQFDVAKAKLDRISRMLSGPNAEKNYWTPLPEAQVGQVQAMAKPKKSTTKPDAVQIKAPSKVDVGKQARAGKRVQQGPKVLEGLAPAGKAEVKGPLSEIGKGIAKASGGKFPEPAVKSQGMRRRPEVPKIESQGMRRKPYDHTIDQGPPIVPPDAPELMDFEGPDSPKKLGMAEHIYSPGLTKVPGIGGIAKMVKVIAGTIHDNIHAANRRLAGVLNEYEHLKGELGVEMEAATMPLSKLARQVFSKEGIQELGMMLMNGDVDGAKAFVRELGPKGEELVKAIDAAMAANDRAFALQQEARGAENVKYRKNYFAREISDYEGLMKHLENELPGVAEQAMRKAENEKGSDLTMEEKAKVINEMLADRSVRRAKPGFLKERSIEEITPDIAKFYEPFDVAMENNLRKVVGDYADRKYFGKSKDVYARQEGIFGAEMANEIAKGRLPKEAQKIVQDNLRDRFALTKYGDGVAASFANKVRLAQSAAYLGQISVAISQFGDIIRTAFETKSPLKTLKSYGKSAANVFGAKLGKKQFTLGDIGVHQGNIENAKYGNHKTMVDEAVRLIVKLGTGLSDTFNKTGMANAFANHYSDIIKDGKSREYLRLREKYAQKYPKQWKAMFEAIKNREFDKGAKMSDHAKMFIYNELADVHPLNPSHQAQGYNAAPAWLKPVYGLKSFWLKQLGAMRTNGYELMKHPIEDPQQFAKGLSYLAAFTVLVSSGQNVMFQHFRDLLGGKKTDEQDAIMGGFLQTFGLSRYNIEQFTKGDIGNALLGFALPAGGLAREALHDAGKLRDMAQNRRDAEGARTVNGAKGLLKQSQLIRHMPIVGSVYYDRGGLGRTMEEKRQADKAAGRGKEQTIDYIKHLFKAPDKKSR